MSRDLSAIYDRAWYEHDFAGLRPEFGLVADGLARWWASSGQFSVAGVLDVGCGPGMLVMEILARGYFACGFDGSRHAIEYARERLDFSSAIHQIAVADVLDAPIYERQTFVICTEVAEHIPAEHARTLVKYLVDHAGARVVMTAAPPGQGGHDHVNEQPREYWLDLFAEHGWIEDVESTRELQARWSKLKRLSHMRQNVMVMK